MRDHKRITVTVSADDLQAAQEFTGKGISETVRIAIRHHLRQLETREAQKRITPHGK